MATTDRNLQGAVERSSLYVLSILRIMSGLLFIEHGTGKLFHFPLFHQYDVVRLFSLAGAAGVIELVGGSLLTLGLFTRTVAFILCGEMAVAYFLYHAPKSFFPLLNGGIPAILYCFIFLYIAAAGGGPWSVDRALSQKDAAHGSA